jgi:phage terminase large subunit-like protein
MFSDRHSGLDVINEVRRLYTRKKWGVVAINPKTDKVARAHSVQPTFSQHLVYAPNRDWAESGRMRSSRLAESKGLFENVTVGEGV